MNLNRNQIIAIMIALLAVLGGSGPDQDHHSGIDSRDNRAVLGSRRNH